MNDLIISKGKQHLFVYDSSHNNLRYTGTLFVLLLSLRSDPEWDEKALELTLQEVRGRSATADRI